VVPMDQEAIEEMRKRAQERVSGLRGEFTPGEEGLSYDNSYETLLSTRSEDSQSLEKFVSTLARHPDEEKFMRDQNSFVRRRELVRQTTSFREIAGKISRGEDVSVISLPYFDGEMIRVNLIKREILSADAGSFVGRIEGDPFSLVTIAFHEGSDAAEIHIPSRDAFIQIQPYDDSLVIVKDVDHATAHAEYPCSHCSAAKQQLGR